MGCRQNEFITRRLKAHHELVELLIKLGKDRVEASTISAEYVRKYILK